MIILTISELLILVPPLVLLEGFYSGSEIALLSADRLTLQTLSQQGNQKAKLALELVKHPERILSTTLLMTSLCVISTSTLIGIYCSSLDLKYSNFLAILITSPLIVLFGEFIPKMIYQRHATGLAPWLAYPIYWTYWAFLPITRSLGSYTTRLSRFIGPLEDMLAGKRRTTREEIQALLFYTKRESDIKSSEKQMIKRIFDFRYTQAQHALIPLVRVDAIDESATVKDALEQFEQHRHSRMPVYSERVDNIIGILETSDLLAATELQQSIRPYLTPAHYAAETQPLQDLLLDMRREMLEMVIIVDEHGGAVGILTAEDIIEEVVGEISDEYDYASLPYKIVSDTSWSVQARMEIQQINEELKLNLPEGNYETLSGFLLQQFGRIPIARDELFFTTSSGELKFTVQKATERHIEIVLIQRLGSS